MNLHFFLVFTTVKKGKMERSIFFGDGPNLSVDDEKHQTTKVSKAQEKLPTPQSEKTKKERNLARELAGIRREAQENPHLTKHHWQNRAADFLQLLLENALSPDSELLRIATMNESYKLIVSIHRSLDDQLKDVPLKSFALYPTDENARSLYQALWMECVVSKGSAKTVVEKWCQQNNLKCESNFKGVWGQWAGFVVRACNSYSIDICFDHSEVSKGAWWETVAF